jgi:topoisomerase-4 subunit A
MSDQQDLFSGDGPTEPAPVPAPDAADGGPMNAPELGPDPQPEAALTCASGAPGQSPGLQPCEDADSPKECASISEGPLKRLVDSNFLQYASYVIRDRAIPDIDDGLKPVQRRILHSLHANDDGKFIKVANIVGYCMQFHPHGDASIGDALVTLVNKRYLIEGQGNFGNLFTGDPAAASRYIECRLTALARDELFNDDLTDFVPTYDGRKEEPVVLPARLPLLLMLGAEGIAVGIATRILPHNLSELLDAQIAILQKKGFEVFPDFPQGGVMDVSSYEQGRGYVKVRARVEMRDASTLVIRELPFGATTDSLIASVEDAARKGKIKLRSINDFTAEAVEIEIQIQPEQDAGRAVEALYAFTQCEIQVPSRIVVIRDNKPAEMDVAEVLRHNTDRLLELLKRKLKVQQRQLTEALHRKTLIQIFIENRLYKPIETCRTPEEVEQVVRAGVVPFLSQLQHEVTRADVEALLAIPIRRISQFDVDKSRQEMERIRSDLAESRENLANLVSYAVRYLRNVQKKYGPAFPRRTRLAPFEAVAVRELTASELAIGHDQAKGYLGYKVGGTPLLECSSLDKLLLVWRDGRYKVIAPPEKLFVDVALLQCSIFDRETVMTVVYSEEGFTHIRKFTCGSVTNRDYRCVPAGAQLLLFSHKQPPLLYVRYEVAETAAIKQQEFDTTRLPVRERDGRSSLMSSKKIAFIGAAKPADWDDALTGPKGTYMDF